VSLKVQPEKKKKYLCSDERDEYEISIHNRPENLLLPAGCPGVGRGGNARLFFPGFFKKNVVFSYGG
jgi:hypothetical protein